MNSYDVVAVCNALIDILVEASDTDLEELALRKGAMHLVDAEKQKQVLDYFRGKDQTIELGGSAMNAIRTLAELGQKTAFAGMVSDDEFGGRIRARMKDLNIRNALGESHEPTGTCLILVTPDGERTMNTCLGASRLYTEEQVPYAEIKNTKILHFTGYQWDTEGQMHAIRRAIETAVEAKACVSFDVADPFVVERHHASFLTLIETDANVVFANKEEARMLYDLDAEATAAKIASHGAIAVIKLGAEGALIQKGDTVHHIAPVSTKVIDTTAAGDMFAAGFLYGMAQNKPLDVCGKMAAILAADVISRLGATVSNHALATVGAM